MKPRAIREGNLTIDGQSVGCAVLADGRRLLEAAAVRRWLDEDVGGLEEVRYLDVAGRERAGFEARAVIEAFDRAVEAVLEAGPEGHYIVLPRPHGEHDARGLAPRNAAHVGSSAQGQVGPDRGASS